MRQWSTLALATALLVSAIGAQAQRAPAATAARPPALSRATPFKPVGSIAQLMESLIDPHADVIWGSVGTIIDEKGVEERRPRTDAEWATVGASALALAEAGNLLMLDGRAPDRDAWLRMSRALVDAGEAALRATEKRDAQALLDAGEAVTVACDTCHGLYWKLGSKYGDAKSAAARHAPAETWIGGDGSDDAADGAAPVAVPTKPRVLPQETGIASARAERR